jgi:hypothetical protein
MWGFAALCTGDLYALDRLTPIYPLNKESSRLSEQEQEISIFNLNSHTSQDLTPSSYALQNITLDT